MSDLVDELRAKAAYAKEAGWDGDAHDLTRACDEIQSLSSRLSSAFHRLGLTDQETEDFGMVMRAVAEAREILIPRERVVERQET